MSGFLHDLRFGLRELVKRPGFAAAAILTLALGIGANTAVFSFLSGYLFKPLPYPHGAQLAQVNARLPKLKGSQPELSMPLYHVIHKHASSFDAMAVYTQRPFGLHVGGHAKHVIGLYATASLFHTLGVQPFLGRTFTTHNMHNGSNHVAVISYGLWRASFGADSDAIGKKVRIDSDVYRIIGVMPQGFAFPDRTTVLWVPHTISPDDVDPRAFLSMNWQFIGRLKSGIGVSAAERQVQQVVSTWADKTLPVKAGNFLLDQKLLQSTGFTMGIRSWRQILLGDRPATLWLLQGAVVLILLITCVNVANLLLSRILGRSHEIAIRSALGATRALLARQLLAEALCLTVPGGLAGVALAWLALHFLNGLSLGAGDSVFNIALDWRVGLFALGAVLVTAALVSMLPIRYMAKTDLQLVLQEGGRTASGGRGTKRIRNMLVITELTLATGLLAMSGLLLHSFMNIEAVDTGFRKDHVLMTQLLVPPKDHPGEKALSSFYRDLVQRVDALPGVQQTGISDFVPLGGASNFSAFTIPGQAPPASGKPPAAMINTVSPGYFKALGIPILRGRRFDQRDAGTRRAIVDARVVKKYFRGINPIGQQINPYGDKWTIVGVVPSIKYAKLSQPKPSVAVYSNYQASRNMYLVIHTALTPSALIKPVQHLIAGLDPSIAMYDIHTMHEQLSDSLQDKQTTMTLLLAFGGIALALAIVGVYAVMSYAVGQRRAECGVRLALGAQPKDLLWLILKDGLKLLAIGLVFGLGLAVVCGYLLSSQLFGVTPFDPVTLIGSAVVLCIITLAACYLPARRAAKIDPAIAIMEQ
jgi:putative ABC transport system permease protein